VVASDEADRAVEACRAAGSDAMVVGEVVEGSGVSLDGVR
jgi:phosphoribosylaminoimidazole (AIR) synthetase